MSERPKRQSATTNHWTAIFSLVIILMALALRLYHLEAQSLWYDEGVSVYLARMSLPQLTAWTADDIQPPLYYYLLHFWLSLFGQFSNEFVVRFPSLFFGVLTVPLMYRMGRHLFGATAGLWAAFLAAISPLYLWYSQETRMYTMLTFLCLLSSYLLLNVLERRAPPHLFLWLAFAAANIAAAYTHYFAFFVMAFQGIYLVAWARKVYSLGRLDFGRVPRRFPAVADRLVRRWMRYRGWQLVFEGLAAFAAITLAYLPWVPFMLYRYRADVSYWQGNLKLNEVLRKTLISFCLGETVFEGVGAKLAVGYGVIALIALAAIALSKRRKHDPLYSPSSTLHPASCILFLLLYLLLPITLIITLSYRVPKFSPRYLMLSSPAFILIIAGGLTTLLQWSGKRKWPSAISRLLSALCLLFILTTSAYADYNNYFNIHFTKADFRGAARRIEENIEPDETVILTSGHMYPVFTYYYGGHNWYPIPAERTLSTERTLNFSVAADLNRALEGKSGVWVVLWQDEVVDPNGFLLMMLEEKGELLEAEDLWHVRLRHFALPEGVHFSSRPDIHHPTEINFEGRIKLLGYEITNCELRIANCELTLYWEADRQLDDDYKVSLRLRDEEGHYWGRLDRRPAAYLYPTTRWKVGELLFGRYALPVLPGTPPGEYQLEVVLYSEERPEGLDVVDADGVARGASAVIGTVAVPKGSLLQPSSREELGISQPLEADFGRCIALLGYELGQAAVQPGDSLYLMLFWQALTDVSEDYSLTVALADRDGKVLREEKFSPLVRAYPTSRWVAGEVWRGQYNFAVSIEAQPGQARLQIGLVDEAGRPLGERLSLASLEVQATERVFTAPETRYPSGANFGDLVTLIGADLDTTTVKHGGTLHLTLYWQARTNIERSYTVFTHLLDADSRIWAQQDGIPVSGARPTTGWVPGEVIRDEFQLAVDPQAPPGDYVIEVGLYDAGDPALPRLPVLSPALSKAEGEVEGSVLDEAGEPMYNRVLLAEVRVE